MYVYTCNYVMENLHQINIYIYISTYTFTKKKIYIYIIKYISTKKDIDPLQQRFSDIIPGMENDTKFMARYISLITKATHS